MNAYLTSWKTTCVGILTALCGGAQYFQVLPPIYAQEANLVCSLLIAIGLISAKDGNVSNAAAPTEAKKVN